MRKPTKAQTLHNDWHDKFFAKVCLHHKRNREKVVQRILKRIETVRTGLIARSKKYNVECTITSEELCEMFYEAYGTRCRYCEKTLLIKNMVVDHSHPISKGGSSTKENLQIICKTSNSMKGSLDEANFQILLEWLKGAPEELRTDVSIRLARGIN